MQVVKKLKAGRYRVPVTLTYKAGRIYLKFGFNRTMINEVKTMEGHKWHGFDEPTPRKIWSIKDSPRNDFRIRYLAGENPYTLYDIPLEEVIPTRPLYSHQVEMLRHVLTRRHVIVAGEMGCLHPQHPLKCTLCGEVKPIEAWRKMPWLKAYNEFGDIVVEQAKRIIKKESRYITIRSSQRDFTVGENHYFLTLLGSQVCLTRAAELTQDHLLLIDASSGIGITLPALIAVPKLTGSASGMETVQSTLKEARTAVSYILETLNSLDNLPETFDVRLTQLKVSLSCLGSLGSICPKRGNASFLASLKNITRISSAVSSTPMAHLASTFQQGSAHGISTLLFAMLQKISWNLSQIFSEVGLSRVTTPTKSQSMVVDAFKNWAIFYTKARHAIYGEKLIASGKPGRYIVGSESEHLIPASFQNFRAIRVRSIEDAGYGPVYDLTMPNVGNYFDAYGISHQNTGKSLVFIEALDHVDPPLQSIEIWYVGPKSGVVAVGRELKKWKSKYTPEMMTYQGLVKKIRDWPEGVPPPRFVCFDESSKLKNPGAQRSAAARHLAHAIHEEWGEHGYILEMSGTPAPKAPTDWWHQCEVACPGYLREGSLGKFKNRLCLIEMRQSISGGSYPHIVSWLDDENKCAKCGQVRAAPQHDINKMDLYDHEWQPTKNEVAALYRRIKDLALIQFKKDCLDLPEKQYQILKVKPSVETLRAARLIRKTSRRAVTSLTLLRELSDGFQYREIVTGKETCPQCKGTGKVRAKVPREEVNPLDPQDIQPEDFLDQEITCEFCDENCQVDVKSRTIEEVPTPKDDAFIQLLDDHEDGGRFVVWGGFTGTVDRLVRICHQYGWATLRVDGRGYHAESATGDPLSAEDFLDAMDATNPRRQELLDEYPKICFVGHPKAGGMALTLNISPVALYYSNDFDGEGRMQSEDRIHRIGMDVNRGALIIDLIHLPTDQLVLDNLRKKKRLQDMTMGEIDGVFERSL